MDSAKDQGETIPLEPMPPRPQPPQPAHAPTPKPSLTPLLEGDLTECPSCHARLTPDAVVCTACGLDMRVGARREVEVGVVEPPEPEPEPAPDARPDYIKPTRLPPKLHLAFAGACVIGAMIATGVNAAATAPGKTTTLFIVTAVLLTLYQTVVHTGTGVVAVAFVARLAKSRVGRYDLAAARVLLAFATFQLISHQRIPGAPMSLSVVLMHASAGAAYFFSIMALFKLKREQAATLCGTHLVMWALFEGGILLSRWHGAELASFAKP